MYDIFGTNKDKILEFIESYEEPHERDRDLDTFYRYYTQSAKTYEIRERKQSTKRSGRKTIVAKQKAIKERRREFNSIRNRRLLEMLANGIEYVCSHPGCYEEENLHIDHIMPLSKGGGDEIENLQFMCRSHNSQKSDKT